MTGRAPHLLGTERRRGARTRRPRRPERLGLAMRGSGGDLAGGEQLHARSELG
ncbi:hypothetical protein [Agromyces italicus]|uniref:hypothetical protein n=1 Tax=Agromyces italicus TaxID=279572 RepID=UPI00146AE9F3|nr:hypothetical protein [Agromyces italicus]